MKNTCWLSVAIHPKCQVDIEGVQTDNEKMRWKPSPSCLNLNRPLGRVMPRGAPGKKEKLIFAPRGLRGVACRLLGAAVHQRRARCSFIVEIVCRTVAGGEPLKRLLVAVSQPVRGMVFSKSGADIQK